MQRSLSVCFGCGMVCLVVAHPLETLASVGVRRIVSTSVKRFRPLRAASCGQGVSAQLGIWRKSEGPVPLTLAGLNSLAHARRSRVRPSSEDGPASGHRVSNILAPATGLFFDNCSKPLVDTVDGRRLNRARHKRVTHSTREKRRAEGAWRAACGLGQASKKGHALSGQRTGLQLSALSTKGVTLFGRQLQQPGPLPLPPAYPWQPKAKMVLFTKGRMGV
jgi:hypothetical protein